MAAPLAPVEVIERSRRGQDVDAAGVGAFVRSWLDGTADDALMAAWCMVDCLRPLPRDQVEELTRALVASGDRLELASLGPTGAVVSAGAVGDGSDLVAAPLASALGVRVAGLGARGGGHVAGTLDKLAAIPGFLPHLPLARFVRQVRDRGIAVTAPSERLAPAAGRLDALRDATGTVPGPGVVAAVLMSRAIAAGAAAIAVDATAGPGGMLGDAARARAAAELMAELAGAWGRRVRWSVTAVEQPLGRCVGTALEVREAGEVLCGEGAGDMRETAVRTAAALCEAAGVVPDGEGAAAAAEALRSGAALRRAEEWVEAQDGDPGVWTDPGALPVAPVREEVLAGAGGVVRALEPRGIGEAARWLGAGRLHPDQSVDAVAGVELLAKVGARVEAGEPLAVVHARDEWAAERGRELVSACIGIGPEPPPATEGTGDAGAP